MHSAAPSPSRLIRLSPPPFVCLVLSSLLFGCVIPVPRSQQISEESVIEIKLGETRRTEIIEMLGTPSLVWETERVIVYDAGTNSSIFFIIPAGYSAAFGMINGGNESIVMQFDEADVVVRLDRSWDRIDGAFLREWIHGKE